LRAGTLLATYLVQNSTIATVRACMTNCPHVFFSYPAANYDHEAVHILKAYGSGGGTWMESEDSSNDPTWPPGEPEYGDLPASIQVTTINLPPSGAGASAPGPKPAAAATPPGNGSRASGSPPPIAPPPSVPAAAGPADGGPLGPDILPGTDYWLTFPGAYEAPGGTSCATADSISDRGDVTVAVTSEFTTTVTGSWHGASQDFAVSPTGVTFLAAGNSLGDTLDVAGNDGVHLTSPMPVTVYTLDPNCSGGPTGVEHWQGGYLALETGSLGTSYVVLAYPNTTPTGLTDDLYGGSQFALVATAPGVTTVTITPTADLPNAADPMHPHVHGTAYTVTNLRAGQTYQQRTTLNGADLTGTTITADKPIAVFGGHKAAFVPGSARDALDQHRNALVQELPPTVSWGRSFVTWPMNSRRDAFRFVAANANTNVTITPVPNGPYDQTHCHLDQTGQILQCQLAAGQVVDYETSLGTSIVSTQPILLAQLSRSASAVGSPPLGDPSMMLIPPIGQFLKDYRLAAWWANNSPNQANTFINIVSPTTTGLSLDGSGLASGIFQPIGSSGFSGATIDFAASGLSGFYHHLTGPVPFGAWVYGLSAPSLTDKGTNYSYPAGMQPLPEPAIRIVSPNNNSTFAAGSTVLVTGVATPGLPVIPITQVTVNGTAVEALDAGGNFSTRVTLSPGDNVYQFTATDTFLRTATVTWTLHGTQQPPGGSNFDDSSDVTVSTTPVYATTAFNQTTNIVYADLQIQNTGPYLFDAPLLVGVRNLKDVTYDGTTQVTVVPRETDGTMPDGTPYYVFNRTTPHSGNPPLPANTLDRGELTDSRSIAFYNPNRRQFTYDLVVLGHIHQAPRFTTVPIFQAFSTVSYIYNVGAVDPEGTDTLTYSLPVGPGGMAFDPGTNVLRWTNPGPVDDTFPVVIRVTNQHRSYSEQSFVLSVLPAGANVPPVFTSLPVVAAFPNVAYSYQPTVQDPDEDFGLLNWSLDAASVTLGMSLDQTTHLLTWTPRPDQTGTFPVVLTVSEDPSRGGIAKQSFCLNVAVPPSGPPNTPPVLPVITSAPPGPAQVNVAYQYQVNAQYIDRTVPLKYSLSGQPSGITINASTGLITGTAASTGSSPTTLSVCRTLPPQFINCDPTGIATQTFNLAVNAAGPNQPPVFTTQPRTHIGVGVLYVYVPMVSDPDNDQLGFSLDATSLNRGMTVDASSGVVNWGPRLDLNQVGDFLVQLTVTDSPGASATQSFTLHVSRQDNNQPPTINSVPPMSAFPGRPYVYNAVASDPDLDPVDWQLDTAPWGMSINPRTGTIRWTPSTNPAPNAIKSAPVTWCSGRAIRLAPS
jgi:hypothetical protein